MPEATEEKLFGIGEAAARAGVSERALRYYQQIGLITPSGCTPGGLRRYSEENLYRVARIRELQNLLGLDLEEVGAVLANEDRVVELRRAYQSSRTDECRAQLVREGLQVQEALRSTVAGKLAHLEEFLAGVDASIARLRTLLEERSVDGDQSPAGE